MDLLIQATIPKTIVKSPNATPNTARSQARILIAARRGYLEAIDWLHEVSPGEG